MIKSIHPFPARMAPELALEKLNKLSTPSIVLDPMMGSGTVLRQAAGLGHKAVGFDMDPLAVLMSRVSTTMIDEGNVLHFANSIINDARLLADEDINIPWQDNDAETEKFVDFWFDKEQKFDLRKLSFLIYGLEASNNSQLEPSTINLLKIALSRLIITKDRGASLARDVSHSRPHKVATSNSFPTIAMFERSVKILCKKLSSERHDNSAVADAGDARRLTSMPDACVDVVITSPPYLNAIDYMRGHRLSLVWLGYNIKELRAIRSNSIGSERSADNKCVAAETLSLRQAMGEFETLPTKFIRMIDRYVLDIRQMMLEIARVMKSGGEATFVIGNSCLRGVFIKNSAAVSMAAELAGLTLLNQVERSLPAHSRYLPLTSEALGRRMRTETVLTFART